MTAPAPVIDGRAAWDHQWAQSRTIPADIPAGALIAYAAGMHDGWGRLITREFAALCRTPMVEEWASDWARIPGGIRFSAVILAAWARGDGEQRDKLGTLFRYIVDEAKIREAEL
jgi:hypothetical protein